MKDLFFLTWIELGGNTKKPINFKRLYRFIYVQYLKHGFQCYIHTIRFHPILFIRNLCSFLAFITFNGLKYTSTKLVPMHSRATMTGIQMHELLCNRHEHFKLIFMRAGSDILLPRTYPVNSF